MKDSYNLQRFVEAQNPVFERVCAELRQGQKQSHWMWFVFPQLAGLGHSAMAHRYAIGSRGEAMAYLEHPVLGRRLRECTAMLLKINGRSIREILGYPDDLKFRSSMTLFAAIAAEPEIFSEALRKFFAAEGDSVTTELLKRMSPVALRDKE